MTRQRLRLTIDALTVEGGRLSQRALARAIETALAERLANATTPLRPEGGALERVDASAHPAPQDLHPEPAIGRAVAAAAHGVLKR